MGGTEPVCRAHRKFGMVLAAPFPSGAPGLHGAVVILCVMTRATEPPAHCRLVSGHDPFEIVASFDCNVHDIV